jgi:hypothetical protein
MPYELLQDGDLQRAETLALGSKPPIEPRAAVDVKAAEKLAAEPGADLRERLGLHLTHAGLQGAVDGDRVDEAARHIERDVIGRRCVQAVPIGTENTSKLAQAPAELAPRVVGDFP